MLATPAAGPLESADYAYEARLDGLRLLAGLEGSRLSFRSVPAQDALARFPEVAGIRSAAHPQWVLLDAEIVVLQAGRPDPQRLQARLRATDAAAVRRLREEAPVTVVVQDILRIGDSWLLDVNWVERREILTRTVAPIPGVELSQVGEDGAAVLAGARGAGLEAVLGKRRRGRYHPGERTRDWLSIRPLDVSRALICGWTEGRGARSGSLGGLLVGIYRDARLVYVGQAPAGSDREALGALQQRLLALAREQCPFGAAPPVTGQPHWVEPILQCRIRHQGWTSAGRLQSPAFAGMVEGGEEPADEIEADEIEPAEELLGRGRGVGDRGDR